MDRMTFLRRYPDKCCADVSRKGESQPCDKLAVAVALDTEDDWWPVCAYHARGRMMPLAELLTINGKEEKDAVQE